MPSKQTMDKLAEAAARLNRASDELNEVLEGFEDQLARAGIGMVYWKGEDRTDISEHLLAPYDRQTMTLEDDNEANIVRGWLLGYDKIEGQWRVAVKHVDLIDHARRNEYDVHRANVPIPLMKAPRIVRVEAAAELEGLAKSLTERLERYADGVESAQEGVLDEGGRLLAQCKRLARRRGLVVAVDQRNEHWTGKAISPRVHGIGSTAKAAAESHREERTVISVDRSTEIEALQELKAQLALLE